MTYLRTPHPSLETMLETLAEGIAQHLWAKVEIRIDYRDSARRVVEVDYRGLQTVPAAHIAEESE